METYLKLIPYIRKIEKCLYRAITDDITEDIKKWESELFRLEQLLKDPKTRILFLLPVWQAVTRRKLSRQLSASNCPYTVKKRVNGFYMVKLTGNPYRGL